MAEQAGSPESPTTDRLYPRVIAAARLFFRLLGIRWHVSGTEHIPRTGGAVLASNHVSYLDFMICGFAARPAGRLVRFMAKDAIFRHRIAGPLMRGMHHISVDRDAGAQAFTLSVKALQSGEVVGLFPEATISRSFMPRTFKLGAARLAQQAGFPLLPMVTWGGHRIFTKDKHWSLRRRRAVMIRVGEPIVPLPGEKAGALTLRLHARIAELVDEVLADYPDGPDRPGELWWKPAHLGGTAPTPAEAAALDAPDARGPG
ncbi:lysophospholipid acyltransferase family protein [soil metagenome]